MRLKVSIHCTKCNQDFTRWVFYPKDKKIYCKNCKTKRQLQWIDQRKANATDLTELPSKETDSKENITVQQDKKEPAKKEDWFSDEMPQKAFSNEITVEPVNASAPVGKVSEDKTILEKQHLKVLINLPFSCAAMLTKFDKFNLSPAELEELSDNQSIQRLANKYLSQYVEDNADEYTALALFSLIIVTKIKMYYEYKKQGVDNNERKNISVGDKGSSEGSDSGFKPTTYGDGIYTGENKS